MKSSSFSRWALGAFLFVLVLFLTGRGLPATLSFLKHLLWGWMGFLRRNLSSMSIDPEILVAWGVASLATIGILHHLARRAFRLPGWRFRTSLAVVAGTSVLFGASFLIPGILLMVRTPMDGSWTQTHRPSHLGHLKMLALVLEDSVGDASRYPESLESIFLSEDMDAFDTRALSWTRQKGVLYPAAGQPLSQSDTFPLLILPPDEDQRGGVVFADLHMAPISAEDIEGLLDRVPTASTP
ncbi:hypothetical protein HNR46_002438 [Haloferula luteola]|uniref:Uncharacterized protein n=1 Tax=Haloferula luteola TaxID=595692 RepID=A0A840V2H9_9BACT|nr:hypothetical protein [Haloferula luteola]MBB5352195.1 hypothetical protein [Haloferula luteola]